MYSRFINMLPLKAAVLPLFKYTVILYDFWHQAWAAEMQGV